MKAIAIIVVLLVLNFFSMGLNVGWYWRIYNVEQELVRAHREIRELDTAYRNLDRVTAKQYRFNREFLFAKGHKKRADNEWPIPYRGKVKG